MCLLSSADFFSKVTFQKKYFRNTIRVSNSLDPDQDRHVHVVCPDLDPNCAQKLSADDKSSRKETKSYACLVFTISKSE